MVQLVHLQVRVVQMVRVVRVVKLVQVVQVVQVIQVVRVVRMINLYDMHSENIWFSASKPSNHRGNLSCHAYDGRTEE